MVSMFASSAVDRGFEPWQGQYKDCEIGICWFTTKACDIKEKEQRLVGSESE